MLCGRLHSVPVTAQSCAYQYAEEAIEEKRFEFLFVYFAVAVLVLHDKVGKSEADNP